MKLHWDDVAPFVYMALMLVAFVVIVGSLPGCVTPYQEPDGKYVKLAAPETRSLFGTNMAFSRLQRCDGPVKSVLFYLEGDFTNCAYLTADESEQWRHGYSRGAGPEIVGAAIVGGSIGSGAALGGAEATAGAAASASNTAIQSVTTGKKGRR